MELVKIWSHLSLFLGLLICWTKAIPFDVKTAEMTVMTGINMAMDAADNIKGEVGTSNELVIAGVGFKQSAHGSFGDVGGEERRRRRRSADENQAVVSPHEHRDKRSPCMAATTVASQVDENIETGEKIKVEGTPTSGGNSGAGRRKRSPDQNDIDGDEDDQFVRNENSKQFAQAIQQMVNNTLNMMSGVIEKIRKSILPPEQFN